MKKHWILSAAVVCVLALSVMGCAQKPKSENAAGAIQEAKKLEAVEAQVNYLVKEANAFINSKQFDEAVKTARHILSSLDANSDQAKSILEKAQAELKKVAEAKAAELKKSFNVK